MIRIAIGADHRGFDRKKLIVQNVKVAQWIDVGCFSQDKCDYPEFAKNVALRILAKEADYGILLCGSGVGMSIAANRFNGIYAGLCWNSDVARMAKEDDNINVLVLPTDFVTPEYCLLIINAWLTAKFKDAHYQDRLDQVDRLL